MQFSSGEFWTNRSSKVQLPVDCLGGGEKEDEAWIDRRLANHSEAWRDFIINFWAWIFFFLTSLPHALDILDFQGLTNKYFDQITCCVLNVSEPFSLSKLWLWIGMALGRKKNVGLNNMLMMGRKLRTTWAKQVI